MRNVSRCTHTLGLIQYSQHTILTCLMSRQQQTTPNVGHTQKHRQLSCQQPSHYTSTASNNRIQSTTPLPSPARSTYHLRNTHKPLPRKRDLAYSAERISVKAMRVFIHSHIHKTPHTHSHIHTFPYA